MQKQGIWFQFSRELRRRFHSVTVNDTDWGAYGLAGSKNCKGLHFVSGGFGMLGRIFLSALSALALAGCAYLQDVYANGRGFESGADPYEKIQFAGERATPTERASCEAAGGTVARDGLLGWEQCIQRFADAGKACSDNSDCLGQCRLTSSADMPGQDVKVTGTCQVTDTPFGCYATVEHGRATPMLCVD
tara:strand:+ start:1621 stop:2190 length:570 start_codon:yes stop_codon:yes gene_type:complete